MFIIRENIEFFRFFKEILSFNTIFLSNSKKSGQL